MSVTPAEKRPMNPEVKAKWVEALRSEEFEQGESCLRRDVDGETKYCCLGVLTELYRREHGGDWQTVVIDLSNPHLKPVKTGTQEFDGEYSYLPQTVQAWAGLDSNDPTIGYVAEYTTPMKLSSLNDDVEDDGVKRCRPFTFSVLADLIEDQL